MIPKRFLLLATMLLALAAGASQAMAAACTCTSSGASATAIKPYHTLDCSTSGTACTITDPFVASGGKLSVAHHLEFENDCAAVVTVAGNGDTAVLHKFMDIQPNTASFNGLKVYDISNAPPAPPGTTTQVGFLPVGNWSLISSGSQSTCFNIIEW